MVRDRLRKTVLSSAIAALALLGAVSFSPTVGPDGLAPSSAEAHPPAALHNWCHAASLYPVPLSGMYYHSMVVDGWVVKCAVAYTKLDCYAYFAVWDDVAKKWFPHDTRRVWCGFT